MLQWGSIEGEVLRPELPPGVLTPQDSWAPAGEDADAGPSNEVRYFLLTHQYENAASDCKRGACCHCMQHNTCLGQDLHNCLLDWWPVGPLKQTLC